jgi:hypothetical protein
VLHRSLIEEIGIAGVGAKTALVSEEEYQTPDELRVTFDGLVRISEDARIKGEDMPAELAALWLQR